MSHFAASRPSRLSVAAFRALTEPAVSEVTSTVRFVRETKLERRLPVDDAVGMFLDGLLDGRGDRALAIPTGFEEMDQLLEGGLRRGHLALIGGAPGVGTSTLALNIAANASIRLALPTVVVAPDSATHEILTRLVSAESMVPVSHIRGARLSDQDRGHLQRKVEVLREAPLYVSSGFREAWQPDQVVAAIAAWVDYGLQLAVVDGTAFTEPQNRDLARALKLLAQRSSVAVVLVTKVLVPFDRVGQSPRLEDLREYRDVVDLLDLVIFVHRDDVYDPESTRPGEADLEIVKHRYGPTRRFVVAFQGHYARFVDMAPLIDAPR